jgi:L-asparaginase II
MSIPVAQVVRSNFVESVHYGSVIALGSADEDLLVVGDTSSPIFPRSCNKLVQAAAMLQAGLELDGELLALAAASHSGEEFQVAGVRRILAQAGLREEALRLPKTLPRDAIERDKWLADSVPPAAVANECSGKHAAMVATCVAAGWDLRTYLLPSHPLQILIKSTLEDLAREPVTAVGVDGCGAPVMAISLRGLARTFASLAVADPASAEGRVAQAVRRHPQWLAGSRRDVTQLMRAVPGLIAKDGAGGVGALAFPDGRAAALKIWDGGDQARQVVTGEVLRRLGVDPSMIPFMNKVPVLGGDHSVGRVSALPLTREQLAS